MGLPKLKERTLFSKAGARPAVPGGKVSAWDGAKEGTCNSASSL
jgi:hypothetical protein